MFNRKTKELKLRVLELEAELNYLKAIQRPQKDKEAKVKNYWDRHIQGLLRALNQQVASVKYMNMQGEVLGEYMVGVTIQRINLTPTGLNAQTHLGRCIEVDMPKDNILREVTYMYTTDDLNTLIDQLPQKIAAYIDPNMDYNKEILCRVGQ